MQSLEPRFSVGVRKRNSRGHFPPVLPGMIVVGVFELPYRASGK
jgi:hypothetical protein